MKRAMRKILPVAVSVAGAAALLLLCLDMFLGSIARVVLQEAGTRYLGTRVSVDAVALSPLMGRFSLKGLKIQNPAGYSSGSVVEVERIDVSFETASLWGAFLKLDDLRVQSPRVNWEGGLAESNFSALQKNLRNALADEGCQRTERKVAIGKLAVRDTRVSLRLKGASRTAMLRLSDIEMEKIGTRGKGLPGAAIAGKVLEKIAAQTARDAAKDVLLKTVADQFVRIQP